MENELEKEFGENNYNVDDSDNANWILSAKGQDVTIPAGKKGINPSGKLSEEQLRTKITNETGDCMIDENGTIMPITAWDYYIDSEPYYIAGYDDGEEFDSGYNGELNDDGTLQYNIPVYIKKSGNLYKITKLGSVSLSCWRSLKSVKIPDNITIIEDAFRECNQLESVDMPNTITTIGFGAFSQCWNLTNIIIPDSVTSIDRFAFQDCKKLTNIKIPTSMTEIKERTFDGCEKLSNVTIPNNVTSIGKGAFQNCKEFTSIVIPNNVTQIEEYAFADCSKLSSINIPNAVTSIGQYAFCNCNELASINIPNNVTTMKNEVFKWWTSSQVINIDFKENEIPSGWNSRWNTDCNAQINYAQ